ncbi:ion channel [Dokdonella sp.]|uniref:ion channel n=1 Tax=Dokdonella sp. TaxID=2291710 RepID=UPI0035276D91
MPDPGSVPTDIHYLAAHIVVVLATLFIAGVSVLVHYEGLSWISIRLAARSRMLRRRKVLLAIWAILALHIVEIWLFGVVCWLLMMWPACGHIAGASEPIHLANAVYLSATTFSTLGFGDLTPVGAVRFLIGTESLVGLVLITWSASFTYLEMQQFWSKHHGNARN